ncbi:uncharacterized protein BKA78DRAFT_320158 [Phyllosticta capitalensis]|uniref:uncharacterized protein n=1 Tax=Phyllosticta capitalensis TaxID=121624 RepID=UPI003131FA98
MLRVNSSRTRKGSRLPKQDDPIGSHPPLAAHNSGRGCDNEKSNGGRRPLFCTLPPELLITSMGDQKS